MPVSTARLLTCKNGLLLFLLLQSISGVAQTVIDYDGNVYNTVSIGNQTWMQENLKTTHYTNGVSIPTTLINVAVDSTSLFQWAYNDDAANILLYGRLYTWFAIATNQNVCPSGWHVPDNSDWTELSNFLGGDSIAAGKMKETGLTHWAVTDSTVTNPSLFTALPAGFRGNQSGFGQLDTIAKFWSRTPFGSSTFQRGYCYDLKDYNSALLQSVAVANCGLSIRCIKDVPTNTQDIDWKKTIELYPNPVYERIMVPMRDSKLATCSIFNAEGQLLIKEQVSNQSNSISVVSLSHGYYLIRVDYEDAEIEQLFIKE